MGLLLYDLYFDIAWLFSPHNHKIVYLVMAVVHVHIVFAVQLQYLSQAFQTFHVPSASLQSPHLFWRQKSLTPLSYKVNLFM